MGQERKEESVLSSGVVGECNSVNHVEIVPTAEQDQSELCKSF